MLRQVEVSKNHIVGDNGPIDGTSALGVTILAQNSPLVVYTGHTVSNLERFLSIDKGRAGRSAKGLMLSAARLSGPLDGALRCLHPEVGASTVHDDFEGLWRLQITTSETTAYGASDMRLDSQCQSV